MDFKLWRYFLISTMLLGGIWAVMTSDHSTIKADTTQFKKPPKQDRLDLAMELEFEMTRDPNTGEIPFGRLEAAKSVYNKLSNSNYKSTGAINWQERGPDNVGGRTRAMIFDMDDLSGNTVIAASVSGGIWKTTQINSSNPQWQEISSQLSNQAVCALAQDPSNPNIIYAGTGEGFFNNTGSRGNGIYKSTNGGQSWTHLSSTNNTSFRYIQKIIVLPSGYVLASTYNAGLQRSLNGGQSWTKVLGQGKYGSSNRMNDIELASNGKLYATAGLYQQDGIYKSSNNGTSWTKLTNGLPSGGYYRIEIAVAPSNANKLFAAFQNSSNNECKGIYTSTNGGSSWTEVNNPSALGMNNFARNQAWYNLSIAVDPDNENRVLLGGIDLLISENGGSSWDQITQWNGSNGMDYMHADQHCIIFHPNQSQKVIIGNDGGVWYTSNANNSHPTLNPRNIDYRVTQFYACDAHSSSGSNYFLCGAQDNGNQKFTSNGMNSTVDVSGGDGGIPHIDQGDPSVQIISIIYNNYLISTNGGANFSSRNFNTEGRFINPSDYDDEAQKLYAATEPGKYLRWNNPASSGEYAQEVNLSGTSGTISFVKTSPNISNRVYFGMGNGDVYRVDNANSGTSRSGTKIHTGTGAYLSSIDIEKDNEDHIIISYSNYGVTSIYETSNGGNSWSSVEGNLPDMPIRYVCFDPNDSGKALVATELGVWQTDNLNNNSTNWVPSTNGLPGIRVDMLKFREADNLLMAATHGRGLFTTEHFNQTIASLENSSPTITEARTSTLGGSCPRDYSDYLFALSLNKNPSSNSQVNISVNNGQSSVSSEDFQLLTNSLTFTSSGSTTKYISVRVYDDAMSESDEQLVLNISSNTITLSESQITINIIDNDHDPLSGSSSNTYQVGNGAIGFSQAPFRGFYEDQRTQIIYKASELHSQGLLGGNITGLALDIKNKNSNEAFSNFRISIKHTSMQSTNQVNDAFESGLTEVFSSNLNTVQGWNNFDFDTPFNWNGTSNILVQFCYNNNVWSLDDVMNATETSYNSLQHRYADSQQGCSLSTIQAVSKNRPNMRFFNTNSIEVETSLATKSSPFDSEHLSHYYSSNGKIIASFEAVGNTDMNCLEASIDRVGASLLYPSWLMGEAASQKTYFIDPSTNGLQEITLYYKSSELSTWPNVDDLSVIKTSGSVQSANTFENLIFGDDLEIIPMGNGDYAFKFLNSGTGGFALTSFNGSVVPVELKSFTVRKSLDAHLLHWTTANEIDIHEYHIERSFDGRHFESIGSVLSKDQIEHSEYFYQDKNLEFENQHYYYRLSIEERSGRRKYSDIRSVYREKSKAQSIEVYPNPVFGGLNIELSDELKTQRLEILIFDIHGRQLGSVANEEQPEIKIDMSHFNDGIYFIRIFNDSGMATETFKIRKHSEF